MSPFAWIKAFAKAMTKKAWREGQEEGVIEASQEFAEALKAIEIDLPKIADKPTKKRNN